MFDFISERVTSSQIAKAKSVDLVKYLMHIHPHLIRYDGKSKRYLHPEHDSCVISSVGFYRFSNHDRGDQIQFLENFCNFSFQDAVRALAGYAGENILSCISDTDKKGKIRNFSAPEPCSGRYKNVWAYLVYKRKIPKEIVESLFENGALYQAKEYNNCVFLSDRCKYAEISGTTDIKFKKIHNDSDPDGFWSVGNKNAHTVYVCESAIDAISLMLLQQKYNLEEDACYASMGGLKDSAVEHLKQLYKKVIIAVDNDVASDEFRDKHTDLFNISPPCVTGTNGKCTKDWNDVLRYCEDTEVVKKSLTEGFYDRILPF